ncbi:MULTISPECIES: hypothetical protein [Streptomyces]|uniref:Uncharacterized protein n=1 Tax=Streptomyces sudanensis TaxID=436397 RepID=A0ABY4TAF0_9ACTN|nr:MULTISPECIES: hypothetical protein [Streptomyces]URN15924.1 hypothetical protein MW084_08125 [Streptomyces sudanensis]
MTDTSGLRRRTRTALAAAALLATTAGLWATDTWPFRGDAYSGAYCWGAWREHEGEGLLGDRVLDERDARRVFEESSPPTAARPEGTCEVTVRERGGTERDVMQVTAVYGRLPSGEPDRRTWLARYLHGSAVALPDGLDGVAASDRAMLVLPAACDADGHPSVVTLDGRAGGQADMARLLVDLAGTAMREAGCASGPPPSMTSPVTDQPRKETLPHLYSRLCGIPGVNLAQPRDADGTSFAGVYGTRLQLCSLDTASRQSGKRTGAHYVMAGTPRLGALFTGLPEGPGRGLVRKTCGGRPTVFYGDTDALNGTGIPDDATVFARYVESVGKRVGCDDGGEG